MNLSSPNSISRPRRVAIAACLILGGLFSFRAVTNDAKATPTIVKASPVPAAAIANAALSETRLITRNIEDIQPGDIVLARDEHGRSIGLKPVKEVYHRVSYHLRHLTFETSDGVQQTLSTTDEHPFWSVTAGAFIDAGSLELGHTVTNPEGETQTLVAATREDFPNGTPVFNFQVTDYHTYFVAAKAGNTTLLVHNADYAQEAAEAARDRVIGLMKAKYSNNKLKEFTTVVAGVNEKTGKIIVKAKNSEKYKDQAICAENLVVKAFGGKEGVVMTQAIRPRTLEVIDVCRKNCQQWLGPDNFFPNVAFQ